jgi:hypothetical protein
VALVQLTEQEPVQVMWHVELPLHDTLPLGPTVVVHVEFPVQFRLQESRHSPAHDVWFSHESEQLPASPPQVAPLNEQFIPELQVQLAPVQTGAGTEEEDPQPARMRTIAPSRLRIPHRRPLRHSSE